MSVSLILTCAGKGERAGFNENKLLVDVNGTNCIKKVLSAFIKSGAINQYIITANKNDFNRIKEIAKTAIGDGAKVVLGGKTRTDSVMNALKEVSGDIVLIHDGARPFVSTRIIKDCIKSAELFGSGITAVPSRDTVARGEDCILDYAGKSGLYIIQTPQAFKTDKIRLAYSKIDGTFNDDGEIYKRFIEPPKIVNGEYDNIKLTYKEDFELLKQCGEYRFGVGFDCHELVPKRNLVLGGIKIEHEKGLLGHSDADVLTHAIMDAILSGASLRDIGYHFPDKDPRYKDIDSTVLLKKVLTLIKEKGYALKSISAVIMAEKPKLLNYIPKITQNLASITGLNEENVGIGATTLEGLGFVGREEGICVHANAVLIKL